MYVIFSTSFTKRRGGSIKKTWFCKRDWFTLYLHGYDDKQQHFVYLFFLVSENGFVVEKYFIFHNFCAIKSIIMAT